MATTKPVSVVAHGMVSQLGHTILKPLAVALIAVTATLSDLLVVTTPAEHGIGGFVGRCGLLGYIASGQIEMQADGCANFLRNMPNIGIASGVNPPIIIANSADQASLLTSAVAISIIIAVATALVSIVATSAKSAYIISLVAVVGAAAALVALAAAEHTARVFSHGVGQSAHVGTGVYTVLGITLCHLWVRGS
jgi:hypothetical protein